MTTQYLLAKDIAGYVGDTNSAMPCSNVGQAAGLATNVEQHITVPTNYKNWLAVMAVKADTTVYFNGVTTATVPAGAFAANTSEIIPEIGLTRDVVAGQTLSFITAEASGSVVTVKFYVKDLYTNVM